MNLSEGQNCQKSSKIKGFDRFKMKGRCSRCQSNTLGMKMKENIFNVLGSKLSDIEKKHISLKRLSNGSIETYYKTYPLGKIKLQGRKHSMQILKSLYDYDVIKGNVNDFIDRIDDVLKYMRKYCK